MIELFVMILAFVGVTIDECPTDEVVLTSVCYWDAAERGNGHGSSFLSTQDAFVNDAMIVDAYTLSTDEMLPTDEPFTVRVTVETEPVTVTAESVAETTDSVPAIEHTSEPVAEAVGDVQTVSQPVHEPSSVDDVGPGPETTDSEQGKESRLNDDGEAETFTVVEDITMFAYSGDESDAADALDSILSGEAYENTQDREGENADEWN